MKSKINPRKGERTRKASSQEILILTDGRVLAHNLTPAMAAVLRELNPDDEPMRRRAGEVKHRSSHELRART
jgi:adenylosuccinate lyase